MSARLPLLASRMWGAAARADVHTEHGNDEAAARAKSWVALWSAAVRREQSPAFVRCRCCHRTYDLAAWRRLRLVGDWVLDVADWGAEGPEALRLKDCRCRNTIAVRLEAA